MPRKISDETIQHAINLNHSGMSIKAAAKSVGVCKDALSKHMKARGHQPIRHKVAPPNTIDLPSDEVVAMYQAGKSENAVAHRFGVARNVIRKRLVDAGVAIRTQSEAEALKWSQMTDDQRSNQVSAAHKASTGLIKTDSHKIAVAKAREQFMSDHHIGVGEPEFRELLTNIGINFTYQKAVDFYNLDFAIGTVAVELTSMVSRYSDANANAAKRIKHLRKCGYKVLAVEFDCVDSLMHMAHNVISLANELDRLNAIPRKYWVIRCRRYDYTIGKNERAQFARIDAPEHFVETRKCVDLS